MSLHTSDSDSALHDLLDIIPAAEYEYDDNNNNNEYERRRLPSNEYEYEPIDWDALS